MDLDIELSSSAGTLSSMEGAKHSTESPLSSSSNSRLKVAQPSQRSSRSGSGRRRRTLSRSLASQESSMSSRTGSSRQYRSRRTSSSHASASKQESEANVYDDGWLVPHYNKWEVETRAVALLVLMLVQVPCKFVGCDGVECKQYEKK